MGSGGFDLQTSEAMEYWSVFLDTLRPYLSEANQTAVKVEMYNRTSNFMDIFYGGTWPLWNGNNWTPYLTRGATAWAVIMWHEEPERAREILHAVYDILWWHRTHYTSEPSLWAGPAQGHDSGGAISNASRPASVYVEGVDGT